MSLALPPEFQSFVAARVASGAYPSEQAVIKSAFDLLERREKLLAHIDEGTQQLRSGNYTTYQTGEAAKFVSDIAALAANKARS